MAFNPLALLQEQQCSPVYSSLDSGDPLIALKQCDEILSRQPNLDLARALKSIALVRLGRKQDANILANTVIQSGSALSSKSILSALCVVLKSLNRFNDEVDLLEEASKASPNSIDIGSKALTAMVKANQWQKAQQISLRLHKIVSSSEKSNDDYFWCSMQAYSLIANDSALPGSKVALPLAQRMIAKHLETHPFGSQSDEIMYLYVSILRKMGGDHVKVALNLLDNEPRGRELRKRSMTLASLRLELLEEVKDWNTIYSEAMYSLKNGDENWTTIQQAVHSALNLSTSITNFTLAEIENLFSTLSRNKGTSRTLRLAPLYLIKSVRSVEILSNTLFNSNLLELFTNYLDTFNDKACAFEDLSLYVELFSQQEKDNLNKVLQEQMLQSNDQPFQCLNDLYRNLNACKLARLLQSDAEITAESEEKSAQLYFSLYVCSVPVGKDLPKTEMQPGDEYALLAAQALIHAAHLCRVAKMKEEGKSHILLAMVILKAALIYSPRGYRLRILLIKLFQQWGAINAARIEYEEIGIKSIQHDTLGWIITNRVSMGMSLLQSNSMEEHKLVMNINRLQSVWKEGRSQVPQMVAKAFTNGIYTRVEEMVEFGKRLDNSMTRWMVAIESCRMRTTSLHSDIDWKKELNECASCIVNGQVSNQQDHEVLMNLMPKSCTHLWDLTSTNGGREPGTAFIKAMLPVAMKHLDIPLPENYESDADSFELSPEEELLSKMCIASYQAEKQDLTKDIIDLLKVSQSNLDKHCQYLPSLPFHSASVALEAVLLFQKSAGANSDVKAIQASFTQFIDTMEKADWTITSKVGQVWLSTLGKLPPALRQGRNAQDVLNSQLKEINFQVTATKAALLEQLKGARSKVDTRLSS